MAEKLDGHIGLGGVGGVQPAARDIELAAGGMYLARQ
jgi:hypothetical protein